MDIIFGLIGVIFFGVFIVIGSVLILLTAGRPIFYLQNRVGKEGKVFKIFKLRTMHINSKRAAAQTTNSDPDVFPVGRILRRIKLDELPQVFNVLLGDMSLVGPRPCLEQTASEMPNWAKKRFELRPGITGLAQVNGNIALSWEERWRYDLVYIQRYSFWLDVHIIFFFFFVVLIGEECFRCSRCKSQ